MIPGTTTKLSEARLASAATINPKTDIVTLTGTTAITTIIPNFGGGFSGMLILVPVEGPITINAVITGPPQVGNVFGGAVVALHRPAVLIYSKFTKLWFVTNIAPI